MPASKSRPEGQSIRLPTRIMCLDASWNLRRRNLNTLSTGLDAMKHLFTSVTWTADCRQWKIFEKQSRSSSVGRICVLMSQWCRKKQNSVSFSISGSSLNYLTCLALYLCLAVTHRRLNNSWRATTAGERRCEPCDSDTFRRQRCC